MRIDHVTFAGQSLDALRDAFAQLGMATDYGGAHSNGVTHMAVLGFDDGSYLELISTLQRGQRSPWWHDAIAGNAGPCGVAVQCDDVPAEAQRLRALGIAVRGPIDMSRQTPSGDTASWTLAYIGDGEPGATLPFVIQDRSPRARRVQPSFIVTGSELTGIARVVLAVRDFDATIRLFRAAYAWPVPELMDDVSLGTRIAHWSDRTP